MQEACREERGSDQKGGAEHRVVGYRQSVMQRLPTEKQGDAGGDALMNAMKGQSFESPRGPVTIDAATRDPVQNVYMRKVERVGGELWNVEFATTPAVRDPMHK